MARDGIDALDKRILRELQRDASLSMATLADRVGSTPSTCHRRYRKLRSSGAVERVVALVEREVAGEAVTVLIGVVVTGQGPADQAALKRFLKGPPRVAMAWMTTGDFDYLLLAGFPDMAAYLGFLDAELTDHPQVKGYRTFVSIDEIKFEPARPLL
jgi:DNA-binding Lrp family transcriptional regulator